MASDWDTIEMDQPSGEVTIQDCSETQDWSDTETLALASIKNTNHYNCWSEAL